MPRIFKTISFASITLATVINSPICFANASIAHHISYKISPTLMPVCNCLAIEATLKGKDSGTYLLRYPNGITQVRLSSLEKPLVFEDTSDPQVVKIFYPPQQEIKINYTYCNKNTVKSMDYPLTGYLLTYFPLGKFLITPEEDRQKPSHIELDFNALQEKFKMTTSFNINNKKASIDEKIDNFRMQMMSIGDLIVKNFQVNKKQVYVLSAGNKPYFEREAHYLEKPLNSQNELSANSHLSQAMFFIGKNDVNVSKDLSRWHYYNHIVATFLPQVKNTKANLVPAQWYDVEHSWFNKPLQKLPTSFYEGMTDYYGFLFALRSGMISYKDYAKIYNYYLKHYYCSPLKYSTTGDLNNIVKIRDPFVSQYKDDFIEELQNQFQYGKYLHIEASDYIFNTMISKEEWDKFRNKMMAGELIELSSAPLLSYAKLNMVQYYVPILGFDTKVLLAHNIIKDIDEQSPAYKAGLRNGQVINSHKIDFTTTRKIARVQIYDNGKMKAIEFKPQYIKITIPQYVFAQEIDGIPDS